MQTGWLGGPRGAVHPCRGAQWVPPGSTSKSSCPWATTGISVGTRFVPCTFGPCCLSTSQLCLAPLHRAPGLVPSGCASSRQHLTTLPAMTPLIPSFLPQTNPSVGCSSFSESCSATKAGRWRCCQLPVAPAPGRADRARPGFASARGALAQVRRQQAPRKGQWLLQWRGQRVEAGAKGGRLPCSYGGLVGVSMAGQSGKCWPLRALAMRVARVGGSAWPHERNMRVWDTSRPLAQLEVAESQGQASYLV